MWIAGYFMIACNHVIDNSFTIYISTCSTFSENCWLLDDGLDEFDDIFHSSSSITKFHPHYKTLRIINAKASRCEEFRGEQKRQK